jgi:hopene-associated glycosyltransferase HpnB
VTTALIIAALGCVVWAYLLAARGGFWRPAPQDAPLPKAPDEAPWPDVVAVIPARDEVALIGQTVESLLRQVYRGRLSVIVVDDHSSDGTVVAARQAAGRANGSDRLTVLEAPGLPTGWTGKLWAVHHGVRHAAACSEPPDYLLLTDADIHYARETLDDLVRRSVRDELVLNSLMAKLHCQTFAERALLPAFIFFFQMLYPFAWVNRPERRIAAAAGGCMLVRRETLQAAGGIEAIRDELIDDCALARLLKAHGPIWLGLTERVRSIRANGSLADIRRMVARSAYAQLRFSPWLLAGTAAAMGLTYLAPPALALLGSGATRWLGALGWVLMALAMQPTLRFYARSPAWGLLLPLIAATYIVFTLDSAYQHWRGRGGAWKGRVHPEPSPRPTPGHHR